MAHSRRKAIRREGEKKDRAGSRKKESYPSFTPIVRVVRGELYRQILDGVASAKITRFKFATSGTITVDAEQILNSDPYLDNLKLADRIVALHCEKKK